MRAVKIGGILMLLALLSVVSLNAFKNGEEGPTPAEIAVKSVETYLQAYNEADMDKKRQMLDESFHNMGWVYTPTRKLDRKGLWDMASEFHKEYRMELIGKVDVHHNFLLFKWRYSTLNGEESWTGTDFCEFSPEGKLTKVVIFFDE